MGRSSSYLFIFWILLHVASPSMAMIQFQALPLSTNGRWIVDQSSTRVKLTCVNLPSNLQPAVTEGLNKQPITAIAQRIISMGFNCVRLNLPLFVFLDETSRNTTVRQSFHNLGLLYPIIGFFENNPSLLDLPLIEAFKSIVSTLAEARLMMILDNHGDKPGRCCSPDQWVLALTRVARTFKSVPWVVGMNLGHEADGSKFSEWYRQMESGAAAVHAENPAALVFLSAPDFGNYLSFLRRQPLVLSFTGKTVFEIRWYAYTDGPSWVTGSPNQVCGRVIDRVIKTSNYLSSRGWPLFVSEFGVDLRGSNVNDNRFLGCFMGIAAGLDLDWALWTLAGSYYFKNGVVGSDEPYGFLTKEWNELRNISFSKRLSVLQSPFRGPGLRQTSVHQLIFHPASGLCVRRESLFEPLKLDSCDRADAWTYRSDLKTLTATGTYFCLQSSLLGRPAKLGLSCTYRNATWSLVSDSKMQLASMAFGALNACLDVDSNNTIVVNACRCLDNGNTCDPEFQWFRLVDSTTR